MVGWNGGGGKGREGEQVQARATPVAATIPSRHWDPLQRTHRGFRSLAIVMLDNYSRDRIRQLVCSP